MLHFHFIEVSRLKTLPASTISKELSKAIVMLFFNPGNLPKQNRGSPIAFNLRLGGIPGIHVFEFILLTIDGFFVGSSGYPGHPSKA